MKIKILLSGLMLVIFGVGLAFGDDPLREEIYKNITGGCAGKPLSEEYCYKAQTTRAFVDVLINKRLEADDIYMRVVQRYSSSAILDGEIRERIRLKVAADVKKPKPRMAIETFNLHFGPVSVHSVRMGGQLKVFNKGKAPLTIQSLLVSRALLTVSLESGFTQDEQGVVLMPGSTGTIGVVLELQHPEISLGPLHESFIIVSNDPDHPQARVTIDAVINQDPVVEDPKQKREQERQQRALQRMRARERIPRSRW